MYLKACKGHMPRQLKVMGDAAFCNDNHAERTTEPGPVASIAGC